MSFAGAIRGQPLFEGQQLLIFEWVLFGVTTPLVMTRLYVQLRFRYRPWREIFLVIAWLLYLGQTTVDTLYVHYHWFNSQTSSDYFSAANPYAVVVLKMGLYSVLTYKNSIYMCKFALLFFYLDLTPMRICTRTWWTIVSTMSLCAIGVVAQIFIACLLCRPLKNMWSLDTYFCADRAWFYIFSWSLFLFTDLLVYIIPFFIILNLKLLDNREKRAAYWMFTIGLINIGSAGIMLTCYIVPGFQHSDPTSSALLSAMYDFVMPFQQGTAILIICLPQVRRFVLGMSQEKMREQMVEKVRKSMMVEGDLELGLTRGNTRNTTDGNSSGLTVVMTETLTEVVSVPPVALIPSR